MDWHQEDVGRHLVNLVKSTIVDSFDVDSADVVVTGVSFSRTPAQQKRFSLGIELDISKLIGRNMRNHFRIVAHTTQ